MAAWNCALRHPAVGHHRLDGVPHLDGHGVDVGVGLVSRMIVQQPLGRDSSRSVDPDLLEEPPLAVRARDVQRDSRRGSRPYGWSGLGWRFRTAATAERGRRPVGATWTRSRRGRLDRSCLTVTDPSVAQMCLRNNAICRFGTWKTPSGTNFSWLRSPNTPTSSSHCAMGFRTPWVRRNGARSRSVVHRAAAYSSRTATTPKCQGRRCHRGEVLPRRYSRSATAAAQRTSRRRACARAGRPPRPSTGRRRRGRHVARRRRPGRRCAGRPAAASPSYVRNGWFAVALTFFPDARVSWKTCLTPGREDVGEVPADVAQASRRATRPARRSHRLRAARRIVISAPVSARRTRVSAVRQPDSRRSDICGFLSVRCSGPRLSCEIAIDRDLELLGQQLERSGELGDLLLAATRPSCRDASAAGSR